MVSRLWAGFLFAVSRVEGHAHQQFPVSRQYGWSRDFYDSNFANVDNAPYAYNAGGVKAVQDRAEALTDPDVLEAAGNGDQFPLYYLERAPNGNYLETNEIAKRHGVCGDPRLGLNLETNTYSTPNAEWTVINSFTSGQVIEMDVVVVYYHWGHFEFFLCDISDMDDPDGVVTQECLNRYPLDRAPEAAGANNSSPIDPEYPGRYYLDPPCRKTEVDQTVSSNMPESAYNVKMPYLLPDIECEHCVLQMHYLSGSRCKHVGYNEFDPPSWNSNCAPTTDKWIDTDMSICGEGQSYPEEFWGCSDIAITAGESEELSEDESTTATTTTSPPSASPSIAPRTAPPTTPPTAPRTVPLTAPPTAPPIAPPIAAPTTPPTTPSTAPRTAPPTAPLISPSTAPSKAPSIAPSIAPTVAPSVASSPTPIIITTDFPSAAPTSAATIGSPVPPPTASPTSTPTSSTATPTTATYSPIASDGRQAPTTAPPPPTETPVTATTSPQPAAGTIDRISETAAPDAEADPIDSGAPGVNPAVGSVLIGILLSVGCLLLEI